MREWNQHEIAFVLCCRAPPKNNSVTTIHLANRASDAPILQKGWTLQELGLFCHKGPLGICNRVPQYIVKEAEPIGTTVDHQVFLIDNRTDMGAYRWRQFSKFTNFAWVKVYLVNEIRKLKLLKLCTLRQSSAANNQQKLLFPYVTGVHLDSWQLDSSQFHSGELARRKVKPPQITEGSILIGTTENEGCFLCCDHAVRIALYWRLLIVRNLNLFKLLVGVAPHLVELLVALWILTTKQVDFLVLRVQSCSHSVSSAKTIAFLDHHFSVGYLEAIFSHTNFYVPKIVELLFPARSGHKQELVREATRAQKRKGSSTTALNFIVLLAVHHTTAATVCFLILHYVLIWIKWRGLMGE